MHTFVYIVGLPYRLILVCEHYIICAYVRLYKCTNKIDVLSTNSILLGVNHYFQGLYGALKVLKNLEFDWTKFKALKSLNFIK